MAKPESFYEKVTLSNTGFILKEFGFESDAVLIIHDGTGNITFSWTGETGTVDGELYPDDGFIALDNICQSRVALQSTVNGDVARVFAWRRSKP